MLDLIAFIEEHDPQVIVYDIPRPYERDWNILRLLRSTQALRDRAWVVTTTDKAALEGVVDSSEAIGFIIGQPYGLDEVVVAAHQAVDTASAGRQG